MSTYMKLISSFQFPGNPNNDPLPITYDTTGGLLSNALSFTQTVSKFLSNAFQVRCTTHKVCHPNQLSSLELQGVQSAFAPAAGAAGSGGGGGGGGPTDGRLFSLSG